MPRSSAICCSLAGKSWSGLVVELLHQFMVENVYLAMENHYFNGRIVKKQTLSMAIFHSYIHLPKGIIPFPAKVAEALETSSELKIIRSWTELVSVVPSQPPIFLSGRMVIIQCDDGSNSRIWEVAFDIAWYHYIHQREVSKERPFCSGPPWLLGPTFPQRALQIPRGVSNL